MGIYLPDKLAAFNISMIALQKSHLCHAFVGTQLVREDYRLFVGHHEGIYLLKWVHNLNPPIVIGIRDHNTIMLDRCDITDLSLHLIVNEPLALCMLLRGHLVLHASAVAKDGLVIIFLGDAGMGKSSMAYTLLREGWTVLADDLTVLDICSSMDHIKIIPTSASLRIYQEDIDQLDPDRCLDYQSADNDHKIHVRSHPPNLDVNSKILFADLHQDTEYSQPLQRYQGEAGFHRLFYHSPLPIELLKTKDMVRRGRLCLQALQHANIYSYRRDLITLDQAHEVLTSSVKELKTTLK